MDLAPYSHMTWDNQRQPRQVALVRVAAMFPAIIAVVTVSALRSQDIVGVSLVAGACFLVASTLLCGTPGYHRFDKPTMLLIGALDLVAVLAISNLPGAALVGALVAVPGLWLGGVLRWQGVGFTAAIGITAILAAEVADRTGQSETGVEHTYWSVTIGMVAAVAMATIVNVWVRQVDVLESQRSDLADALSQLEEHQRQLATIVSTVDVGLATVGADGSYTSLNPRHCELMALAFPDGHLGRAGETGDIFFADTLTRVERSELPSVRALEGMAFTDTLWVGSELATQRAIAVSANPILGAEGAFAGAVIAYHDITSRMLALRVKDDFVAMVSHELRTPLTSILGSLELAADLTGGSEELADLIAVANRNADRMLHLVGDLLAVSRDVDPTSQMELESLDLSDVVRQSVQDVVAEAERRDVELVADIEPGLRLMGARGRLLQVTDNLLSNALKYTPPGGQVTVRLIQDTNSTRFTVRDTGIGVSEADQDEVFTKFFRGRNVTDLQMPGVGLGLTITKSIVEAHGGSISLASREGEGTTMTVSLPSPGLGVN